MVWADQRNGQEDTDIWLTRSHNFGDNWSSPVRINDDGPGHHQYVPSMAVDQTTGYIYLIYYDRRDGNGVETDLYLAFSTDGGVNFKNIRISESSFSSQPSDKVSIGTDITAHNGIVVPVWTRVDGGQTSIWTASINHEDLVKATTQKK